VQAKGRSGVSRQTGEQGQDNFLVPASGRHRGGQPPALTPVQVEVLRRRRRGKPKTSLAALAAEFGVATSTVVKALRGVPPYDFGEPVPPTYRTVPHRDRGRGGHGRKRDDVPRG
jgi:hypothetical protein